MALLQQGMAGSAERMGDTVEGGEPTKVLDAVHPLAFWTLVKDGIYFFTVPDEKGHTTFSLKEFATGKIRKIGRSSGKFGAR